MIVVSPDVAAWLETRVLAVEPSRVALALASQAPWLPAAIQGRYEVTPDGIAVVTIATDMMVARSTPVTEILGAIEYDDVVGRVSAALEDPSVRGVVVEIDSAGGEVAGLFEAVDRMRAVKTASGKPVWAAASHYAASAAYAIATAADKIYVTRNGFVGSIGVVATHLDVSAADTMAGLRWTFIAAGGHKLDANPHEPLSAEARAELQAHVDAAYKEFVAAVASARGMTQRAVRATDARLYRGAAAIDVGLADVVGSVDDAVAAMADVVGARRRRPGTRMSSAGRKAMENPEHLDASTDIEASVREEAAALLAVADAARRLGIQIDVADAMRRGIDAGTLSAQLLTQLADRASSAPYVDATLPAERQQGAQPQVSLPSSAEIYRLRRETAERKRKEIL